MNEENFISEEISFMDNELISLYYEVSIMAKWLKGNFKTRTQHKRLSDYLAANQSLIAFEIPIDIDRCMRKLNYSEESLKQYLDELKEVFELHCNRGKDLIQPAIKNEPVGLVIPSTVTQFYWDKFGSSDYLQFQGNLSFQTGEIITLRMFPKFISPNYYYVKDKRTHFDEQLVITGYVLAVYDIVPIEE